MAEYEELVEKWRENRRLSDPPDVNTGTAMAEAIERLTRQRDELDAVVEQRNAECSRNFKELTEARAKIERLQTVLQTVPLTQPCEIDDDQFPYTVDRCIGCHYGLPWRGCEEHDPNCWTLIVREALAAPAREPHPVHQNLREPYKHDPV